VFERIPVKDEVFKKLDEVMKPGALLYTNTSGIDIDIIGQLRPSGRRTWPARTSSPRPMS